MTLYDNLNTVYTRLYGERDTLVSNISTSTTTEETTNAVNALADLDNDIQIIQIEMNKLTSLPELVEPPKIKDVPKKKVGRPSKKSGVKQ
jgi:hypothetical protein